MKYSFNYLFLLMVLLNSCSNEDDQIPVFAGEYDSNFIYHEFSPPLQVELELDTITNYYSGTDSIDINIDGKYDLIIYQHLQIPHLTDEPTQYFFPYCRLKATNGLEVATKEVGYPAGHGYYMYVSWIDSLNLKTRIDNITDWSKPDELRSMWFVPTSAFIYSFGYWYEVTNPEMYVGIRMKNGSDYKYGWIKVDATSLENMRFMSYAIEK